MKLPGKEYHLKLLTFLVFALGATAFVYSAQRVDLAQLDRRFLILAVITVIFGSRITVQIPRIKSYISVSDTFIFLIMMMFGGEAAVLVASIEAFSSSAFLEAPKSVSLSNKIRVVLYNSATLAISTLASCSIIRFFFGRESEVFSINEHNSVFITALCVLALAQYAFNSGLVAVFAALKNSCPILQMWRTNFLWTSITYFAGAFGASFIAQIVTLFGFYAFIGTIPIIAIVYLTYRTYLRNIEVSARQTEQATEHIAELSLHIAEQERISLALQKSEEGFRRAFDHAAGMALVAIDGHWLQVNRSLCKILGYTEQELLATNFQRITHPQDVERNLADVYQLLDGNLDMSQIETRYVHRLGDEVWVLLSVSIVRDTQNRPLHFIFQIQDITERKRAEEQIHFAAFHDILTGLPNRALITERMSAALERMKRGRRTSFAVLFLDLDRFKLINDSLGHTLGDRLLVSFTERLMSCTRETETISRLGGDEFAILLDDISDCGEAVRLAERVQKALEQPFMLEGHEVFSTVSIGIAFSNRNYRCPDDILRDADTAMYRAKAHGRACYEIFDDNMHQKAMEALRLETALRYSVERQEFCVHYQPIISLDGGRIAGFEALVRWEHPELGLVMPDRFISVAEETGLIVPIGLLVLRKACHQVRQWQHQFPSEPPLTLSVNLSTKQFMKPDLVEQIERILLETGLDPHNLTLEITESAIMEDVAATTVMLERLRSLNVRLSIDDFGTGYSSLSYLHRFPITTLKIDRSFVNRIGLDDESAEIVSTIITLARNLDMRVVAEGIETEQQAAHLKALNCEYGQGYLFSKPISREAVESLILSNQRKQILLPTLTNGIQICEVTDSIN